MNKLLKTRSVKAATAPTPGATHRPQRILVVDDDISIRQLSTEVLIHSGYEVDAAEDGAAAWQALNTDSYDLLITDHNMPKVTGVELLKKLRAARMALPVIMATGTLPKEEFTRYPLAPTRRYVAQALYRRGDVENGERSSARDRRCPRAEHAAAKLAKPAISRSFAAMMIPIPGPASS